MNYFLFTAISAFSIVIPSSYAVYSYQKMKTKYFWFLAILITGFINEVFSWLSIYWLGSNLASANIYTLVEYLLYCTFFYKLKKQNWLMYGCLLLVGMLVWVIDNMVVHELFISNSLFRIFSSMIIICLSLHKISQIALNSVKNKHVISDLLLCFSFVIYFSYRGFIHVVKFFSIVPDTQFYIHLWIILTVINLIVNILFFIVVLCIPKQLQAIQY